MRNSDVSWVEVQRSLITALVRRFTRRQNVYSVVTSAVPGILALIFVVDFLVGHDHIKRSQVVFWLVAFGVMCVTPLVAGGKYHPFGGLIMMGMVNLWSWQFVSSTTHAHTEVNAVLQVPMLALYVGWFYRTWIARLAIGVNLLVIMLAMVNRGWENDHEFSSLNALAYALIISLFCVELAAYMRKKSVEQSQIDPLTKVLNRRGLTEQGTRLVSQAQRTNTPLSVVVVDFDDFKAVNDAGGHAAGDQALRVTARIWKRALGDRGVVARTGGDEFALLIHQPRGESEELLRSICATAPYSWSWGITQIRESDSLESSIARADAAMYLTKRERKT